MGTSSQNSPHPSLVLRQQRQRQKFQQYRSNRSHLATLDFIEHTHDHPVWPQQQDKDMNGSSLGHQIIAPVSSLGAVPAYLTHIATESSQHWPLLLVIAIVAYILYRMRSPLHTRKTHVTLPTTNLVAWKKLNQTLEGLQKSTKTATKQSKPRKVPTKQLIESLKKVNAPAVVRKPPLKSSPQTLRMRMNEAAQTTNATYHTVVNIISIVGILCILIAGGVFIYSVYSTVCVRRQLEHDIEQFAARSMIPPYCFNGIVDYHALSSSQRALYNLGIIDYDKHCRRNLMKQLERLSPISCMMAVIGSIVQEAVRLFDDISWKVIIGLVMSALPFYMVFLLFGWCIPRSR